MQNTAEDISNAASGHKANLSNPSMVPLPFPFLSATCRTGELNYTLDTSEASKAHSKEVLESMPDQPHYGQEEQNISKNPGNVAGGLKA